MRAGAQRVVVVGAGHAGATFVALLRQAGYAGEVVLFGDEPDPPYHRPPLSKQFLGGAGVAWLYEPGFYAEQGVDLRLADRVVALDTEAGTVTAARSGVVAYDHLVLATGAAPRLLDVPGAGLDGVQALRSLADARALRERVGGEGALVVVGGGYIGLEVAAAARGRGVPAAVVEREDRVLARVASRELAGFLRAAHEARGTEVLTGQTVLGFEAGPGGAVGAVVVSGPDGTERALPCAVALVGVGASPRDALARAAGLACADGIVVDEAARTSHPRVLAVGDVTCRPVPATGARRRLESIPSAVEQAGQAVRAVLGREPAAPETPWFWSDQFALKIKIAGVLAGPYATVARGAGDGQLALFHHRDGELVAVEAVNAPAAFMAGRRMIARRRAVDPARLADPSTALRELAGV